MMQGERNHPSSQNGVGLDAGSQLVADGSFVDSSQAEMFLELLKAADAEDVGNGELAGVEAAVEAVRITLNELVATLVRKRCKTRLVSVGMFETSWLDPSAEHQSCARIDDTAGEPISFFGMKNEDFRILTQAMMGIATTSGDAKSGPLANSEKQLLGVVADRLLGKLYTASDPIETIGMPAPAKICQPEDALDLADRGFELVLVKFEVAAGELTLPIELLFPLELLEAAMAGSDGEAAEPSRGSEARKAGGDETAPGSRRTAKLSIGDVPVSVACELFSAEFPLSEVERMVPGQMLGQMPGETGLLGDIRILDAENRPFLSGALKTENGKLTMIARSMIKNTSEGEAG